MTTNVKMRSLSPTHWTHHDSSLRAEQAAGTKYLFTYSTDTISCDTEIFTAGAGEAAAAPQAILAVPQSYGAPNAPIQALTAAPVASSAPGSRVCPAIQFQQVIQPIPSGVQFSFTSLGAAPAWVDVHYGLAGQNVMSTNVRMKSMDGGKTWIHNDLTLTAGQLNGLKAMFTYCVNGVDCDTEVFSAGTPAPLMAVAQPLMASPTIPVSYGQPQAVPQALALGGQCPSLQFQQSVVPSGNGLGFSFNALSGTAAWVDVHWGLAGQPITSMNVRMKSNDGGKIWAHNDNSASGLNAGQLQGMKYYFSYSANGVDCDTEQFAFGGASSTPAALMAPPSSSYGAPAPAPAQPIMAAPTPYGAPVAPQALAASRGPTNLPVTAIPANRCARKQWGSIYV